MTYVLIEDSDSTKLINKINVMLVAGWVLQGGISYNTAKHLYLQAMVMIEK